MSRASQGPLRVLWLDTEQSDESTQDILLHLTSSNFYNKLCSRAVEQGLIVREKSPKGLVFYHRHVRSCNADGRQEMVQGRLFADDASDSISTLDQMGDGPVDDLPF